MTSSLLTDDEFEIVRQAFLADTQDRLADMESSLQTYAASHQLDVLRNLARAAHTIKGDAATVGLETVSRVATHLQDTLDVHAAGERPCDHALVTTFSDAVLFLREAIASGLRGEELPATRVAAMEERLVKSAKELSA